jgi:hypothetical protein
LDQAFLGMAEWMGKATLTSASSAQSSLGQVGLSI